MRSWGLTEGDVLTPELTVVRRLGGGAVAEAYLAFDEVTYVPVVAKVLRPHPTDDPQAGLSGLRREVEALQTVNHPVVVRLLRHRLDVERPHLVLEHLDGPRLSSLVRRHGPLQPQQYLPLALDLASALHYLRHLGWTHLDIKPSNIIMGAPARLIDLSVARPMAQAEALRQEVGTDAYMAPEQCAPGVAGAPGHPSDVWGLGATLFEALTGRRPFDDGEPRAEDRRLRYPQLVQPHRPLPAATPAEVVEVVHAALSVDPEARPLPHEISEALGPVLARQPRARLAGLR